MARNSSAEMRAAVAALTETQAEIEQRAALERSIRLHIAAQLRMAGHRFRSTANTMQAAQVTQGDPAHLAGPETTAQILAYGLAAAELDVLAADVLGPQEPPTVPRLVVARPAPMAPESGTGLKK